MTRREVLGSVVTSALALVVPIPRSTRLWPEGTKEVYRWDGIDWVPVLMQHLRPGDFFKTVDKEGVVMAYKAVDNPTPQFHLGEGRYGIMAWDAPYVLNKPVISND